jgi:hypothetical protein
MVGVWLGKPVYLTARCERKRKILAFYNPLKEQAPSGLKPPMRSYLLRFLPLPSGSRGCGSSLQHKGLWRIFQMPSLAEVRILKCEKD